MPIQAKVIQNLTEEGGIMCGPTIVGYRNECEYD